MSFDKSPPILTSLSRRAFFKSSAALALLGAMGEPLLSHGARAQEGKKLTMSGSHWGVFRGKIENGRLTSVIPWEKDPHPNTMLQGMLDSIYSPTRIKYPMVRRAWLEKGPGADPEGRGTGDFVRISWEKALDLVAGELSRVRKQYGSHSIFGGSYGWKSVGKFHNCRTLLQRMLQTTGGSVNSLGDYSTGAAQVILPHVVGSLEVYEQCTTWDVIKENTKLLVFWGCNPVNTNQIGWLIPDHGGYEGLDQVKKAGIRVICIDPINTETCQFLNGEWLAPRPQTDVAMMMGIAYTLYEEKLYDKTFLDKYTVGFEQFLPYLLGQKDNIPKNAEWASSICGIKSSVIKQLARDFAKNRTMIAAGWSIQRQHHGEQAHWMIVVLCSMLGQIGLPGGGFGFSYHYCSGGSPTATSPILSGITAGKAPPASDLPAGCAPGSTESACQPKTNAIPVCRLVESLLNPGKVIQYNGSSLTLPEIHLAYWVGGNPFAHQQNRNEMIRAWKKIDTFIVHDFQWTASARHADIVLPVTTSYERNDIEQLGDYALSHIVPMKKLIEPLYESRSDYDIFADICDRLGKRYEYTEGLDEMDWIRNFYHGAMMESRAKGMEMPTFDVFWNSEEALAFPIETAQKQFVRYASYREDPLLNALGTPSGKIEIYSQNIEKMHYDDCPPHPTWMEPIERLNGPTTKYSLHIASNHPIFRLHSQLCGTKLRENYTIGGREPCWINPKDAEARNLKEGDIARAYNDRGQILVGIKVTDNIMPGVIRINEGGWYDPLNPRKANTLCRYGDVNNLTVGIATSKLAQANCGHTAVVELEKFEGELPSVTVFQKPS
ncbi:Dimethyl sulfoxide/trimethylamine N-oxide reductase [Commensalibacter sp. Nvir]|uniref:trimethylamine-N-oxide reductase TorA n=1 Tax=Commensalibacter sp. Nvir TaxID=3069817 RepID=UPI002D22A331|nr:Dimethyl sulfoxide/trimethylamine N-oxide reductase [Commensalibacter sp. Nvir]